MRYYKVYHKQKNSTQIFFGLLQLLPVPSTRFNNWYTDFFIDLPPIKNSHNAMFKCIDKLDKFLRLILCTIGSD